MAAKNCEWMFADVATGLIGISAWARYSPLRWSGAIPFDECIKQLEEALKKSDRRITVKAPAGISSKENIFSDIASAIAFVEDSDPVRRGRKVEEGIRQEAEQAELLRQAMKEERINRANENIAYYDAILTETAKNIEELNAEKAGKTAASAAAKDPDCEWMFGDLPWADKFNYFRWSGKQSFDVAVDKLESEKKTEDRPIIVKVPAGLLSPENRFPDCQAAIDFIKNNCPKHLTLQAEEVEVALQNAMEIMDDAREKLQECRDELQDAEAS